MFSVEPARIDPFQLLDTAKRLQLQTAVPAALATGIPALDAALPDSGLPRGQVIELAVNTAAGLGTSLALRACHSAQQESAAQGQTSWCAFVDPSASLYAPAVLEKGIDLKRLLVIRPSLEALTRVVLRLAEAKTFSVIVVDTLGYIGENIKGVNFSQHWVRVIRRLSLAVEGSHTQIILLTDKQARRSLPLPVGLKLELGRKTVDQLEVQVSKEKRGRISEVQVVRLPKRLPEHPLKLVRPLAAAGQKKQVKNDSPLAASRLQLVHALRAPISEAQVKRPELLNEGRPQLKTRQAQPQAIQTQAQPQAIHAQAQPQAIHAQEQLPHLEEPMQQRPLFPERALGNYSRASR